MNKSVEQRVIARAAAGDRRAAEALIQAHQGSLYSYIVRMCGKPDLAEDVVQEAFVKAITHLDRFDPRYRFSTWVFTIARRVYLNIVERKRAMTGLSEAGQMAFEAAVDASRPQALPEAKPTRVESSGIVRDRLQQALGQLSPVQREVVVLFHQQDWPVWLVAEHLGMPEGTVKSHLHRARTRLREILSGDQKPVEGSLVTVRRGFLPSWLTGEEARP